MHGFWKTWMTVWCWVVLVFGAVLALAAFPATNGPARLVYTLISGGASSEGVLDPAPMRFAIGLQGALTIGWVLTIFSALRAAESGGAPVWRALTGAMLVWYVADSGISAMTGFPLNALSNTALLAGFLAPVLGSGVLRTVGRAALHA